MGYYYVRPRVIKNMLCQFCETELPPDAICCYRCGKFTDGTIRQVVPLSLLNDEQTTHVRPGRTSFAPQKPQESPANAKSFTSFIILIVVISGVILGVVGLVSYLLQRNNSARSETPQNTSPPTQQTALPTQTATVSRTPTPKLTQSSTPLNDELATNQIQPPQTNNPPEQAFQFARDLLKRDMLQVAVEEAKDRHPLSNVKGCSQQVTQTLATDEREEWVGVYTCQLQGAIVGEKVFETQVVVEGAVDWQNNRFARNVGEARVTSDRILN